MASTVKMKRAYYNFNIDNIALQEAEILVSHYDRIQGGAQMGMLVPQYTIYMGEGLSVLNDSSGCTPIPFFDGLTQSEAISYATYMAVANSEQLSIYNKKYTQLISELRTKINDTSTWAQGEFDEVNSLIDILNDTVLYGIIYDSAIVGQLMSMTSKTGSAVSEYLLPVAEFVNNDLSSLLTNLRNSIDDGASTWNSDTYNDPGWAILKSGSIGENSRILRRTISGDSDSYFTSNNIDSSDYFLQRGDTVIDLFQSFRGTIDPVASNWDGTYISDTLYSSIKGDPITTRITDLRDAIAPNGYWLVDDSTTAGYCDFTAHDSCSLIQLYEDHTALEHWDTSSSWMSYGATDLYLSLRDSLYTVSSYVPAFPIFFTYIEWDTTESYDNYTLTLIFNHPSMKWFNENNKISFEAIPYSNIEQKQFAVDIDRENLAFLYPEEEENWEVVTTETGQDIMGYNIDIPLNTGDCSFYVNVDTKRFLHFVAKVPPGTIVDTYLSKSGAFFEGSEGRLRTFDSAYRKGVQLPEVSVGIDLTGYFPSITEHELELYADGASKDKIFMVPRIDSTNDPQSTYFNSWVSILNKPITYLYISLTG